MDTVDELIELLEKFRGHKLNVIVSALRPVGRCKFPENVHGKLVFCDSSCSDKGLMLELETEEELTILSNSSSTKYKVGTEFTNSFSDKIYLLSTNPYIIETWYPDGKEQSEVKESYLDSLKLVKKGV